MQLKKSKTYKEQVEILRNKIYIIWMLNHFTNQEDTKFPTFQ